MEGSLAHPLSMPPSRCNPWPVQNGPLSLPGPSNEECRPAQVYQSQEQWLDQEHRQGTGARPQGRHYGWRRPRNEPFIPHKPRDDKRFERMAVITGFPANTPEQDLIQTLSEFGTLEVDRMFANTAVLLFSDSEKAAEAIRASENLWWPYGEALTITPYTKAVEYELNDKMYRIKEKGPKVDPKTLSWEGDFQAQVDSLLNAVLLTPQEIHHLKALYHDLDYMLQETWPGCRIIPFGSATTGLGMKGSDADCFVQLPWDAARLGAVNRARRALARYPRLFTAFISISNASTPLLKFFHLPSKTHCDLTFKNLLGVQNSKLLTFLLRADSRVFSLAVMLKYWASVHELSGTGKLTNYTLTLMLIYYLQQLPEPLLPSVAWLQQDPACDNIVDGWNAGFMNDHSRLPPITNTSSIADLLGGFFTFYSQLDWEIFVICPYQGCCITKDTFTQLDCLPPDFARYKNNVCSGDAKPLRVSTPMCVQDPFEQSRNVAMSVRKRFLVELENYIELAAQFYEQEKAEGCKNYLEMILLERPTMPRSKSKRKVKVSAVESSTLHHNINYDDWPDVCAKVRWISRGELLEIRYERVPTSGPSDADSEKIEEVVINDSNTTAEEAHENENESDGGWTIYRSRKKKKCFKK